MSVALPAKLPRWGSLLEWVAVTFVVAGERTTYLGNIYRCTVKGTTSGAGGPPADNIAGAPAPTWILIGANAPAWAAGDYDVGDRVTNAGNAYMVLREAAADANSTIAPTGTSSAPLALGDGYTWIFIAAADAVDTEPTEGQKDVGWIPGQRPPAQIFNWLLWVIYRWLLWLQDIQNQALTWTTTGTFAPTTTNSVAVVATGSGNARAGAFTGGPTSGSALSAVAGDGSNGTGVWGIGDGNGPGVYARGDADGGATGVGVDAAGADHGVGLLVAGNSHAAPIRIVTLGVAPDAPVEGDLYYDSTLRALREYTGAAWQTIATLDADGFLPFRTGAALPLGAPVTLPIKTVGLGGVWTASLLEGRTAADLSYWKDATGMVHLKGMIAGDGGAGAGTLLNTNLPAGFRPAWERAFLVPNINNTALGERLLEVQSDGSMTLDNSTADTLDLSCVSWLAEA